MTVTIGELYMDADAQRVTPVEYNNTKYEVSENLWIKEDGDEWAVTLSIADRDFGDDVDRQDIHEWLRSKMDATEVLAALDYTMYDYDDGVSFWSKSANSCTNDNQTNQD